MATKKQVNRLTSPKGKFRYPALTAPDYGTEEYPKKDGEYKVDLVLSREEAEVFASKLRDVHEQAVSMGEEGFNKLTPPQKKKLGSLTVNELFTEIYDKETEELTGEVYFRFKTTASGIDKKGKPWNRTVPIYDAKGNRMVKPPSIWGGTVGKVSFTTNPYFIPATGTCGVTLYLEGAQIIDLVSGGTGVTAAEMGFGEEEGYEHYEGDSSDFPSDDAQYPTSDGGQDEF